MRNGAVPYIVVNEFTEDSLTHFRNRFLKLERDMSIPFIVIYVDTYGGSVYELLAMVSMIESCESKPVITIVDCKACSAGAVLAASGHKGYRFMSRHAHLMIHQISTYAENKLEDVKIDARHAEELNEKLFKLLDGYGDKRTGYFKKRFIQNMNTDWYLTAHEAQKEGLIDHITLPRFQMSNAPTSFNIVGVSEEDLEKVKKVKRPAAQKLK